MTAPSKKKSSSNSQAKFHHSLANKVISLLLVLFFIFAVVSYFVQNHVIYPSFEQLEEESAVKNVDRAILAIQRELEVLKPQVADWANWDATYQFIADENQGYIEDNLYASSVQNIGLNFKAFYNLEGKRIWGLGLDLVDVRTIPASQFLPNTLDLSHPILADADDRSFTYGMIKTSLGPMLFVSHPILTDDEQGPARGTVIFGRLLNNAAVSRIAEQSRITLNIQPATTIGELIADKSSSNELPRTRINLQPQQDIMIGQTTLLDIEGQAAFDLIVSSPRTITSRGDQAMRIANVSVALAALSILFCILVLLRVTVFTPVTRLTEHAIKVGREGENIEKLKLDRSDEVGVLADEFDIMMDRLNAARQHVSELSYQSGLAEMASGVLHNIGNAITPLSVKLTMLKQSVLDLPLKEIAIAREEIANPNTPDDRRKDMTAFMALALDEINATISQMPQEMDAMRTQIDHVQSVLADQQRFSRAERLLETITVEHLLADNIALMPEPLKAFTRVEMSPAIKTLPPIMAGRIALQQVINNLLINAAESIRASNNASNGLIQIHIGKNTASDSELIHLCFTDNGTGIAPENIKMLFESGFSTKQRGSGVGLHWCANTVSAMGGRIYAESPGLGQGASMHLLLPKATETKSNAESTI